MIIRCVASLIAALVLTGVATSAGANTLAGGSRHTVVVTPDGVVWTWGGNGNGQLGDGSTIDRRTPEAVPLITDAIAVAAGSLHTLVLRADGTVLAWGYNWYGQLGDGSFTQRTDPVPVSGLTGVVAIAAGQHHSVALTSAGQIYTWGRNNAGQLGDGTTTHATVPVLLTALTGMTSITAGDGHTVAVKSDGTAWAWGLNSTGQLGDASTTQRTSPVQMSGVTGAAVVAAGGSHTLILMSDGTLRATGYNFSGQLGDNSNTQRTSSVAVSTLTGVTAIDANTFSSYARTTDGSVWAWGGNSGGRLGDGTLTNRKIPTQTSGLTGISLLGAGDECGIAVTSTGVVYTWGYNAGGQLGDGTLDNRLIPIAISDVNYAWKVATPVFSVASGTYTTERTVIVTNATPGATIHYTLTGDAPTESDAVIASGASLLIDETRTLKARAWKTGMPASSEASATYTLAVATVVLSPTPTTYTSAQNVSMSTSSPGITIRYTVDGTTPTESSAIYSSPLSIGTTTTVKAVGFRANWSASSVTTGTYTMNFGTLAVPALDPGTGSYTSQAVVTITAFAGATIRYTTNGSTPTSSSPVYTAPLVIEATTTVKAKAFHPDYATSAETASAYTIVVPAPTVSVGSGAYAPGTLVTLTSPDPGATLRITLTGTDPIASDPSVPSGTTLAVGGFTLKVRAFKTGCSDSGVAAATYSLTAPLGAGVVAAGGSHSAVATPEGLLYAWGQNTSGQVGIGTTTNRTTPVLVPTLTGVTALAGGQTHTLAATVDGRLFAWGGNSSGQLGDGTTTTRTRPVHIAALSGIIAVAAGASHSLALTAEGEIYAWGLGSNGRLGLGSTTSQQVPTLVPGLSGVVAIAAGSTHSLAVTSAGQVYAWGANSSSQLGDGSTTTRLSPTLIAGGTAVIAVAAGASHSLALRGGGEVLAWGAGSSGQLGLGTTTTRTTPTSVPDLTAVALTTTGAHGLAVRSDGVLVAWGANASGQIGDTTTTTRTVPTVVIGPASVVALAAGGSHSIAVTTAGDVWTWGAGGAGQLGDGGTATRSTPGAVFTAPGTWGVAAPTLSVPSGTYHVSQTVVVSSGTPDAIVRYTTSGIDPTESDPVIPVTGEILVDASLTLRARAWVPGRAPSAIAAATYTLQPASPTITPSTGTYSTAQSVSLSTTTGDTTLRYTLDGTDPTETSPLYTGPFTIETSAVAKARAFRANWTPSATVSATLTFNYGMLAEPIASPGGGTYPEAQTVALTAVAGATMRYTLDGSDPTEASQLYGAPIAVGPGSTILKARAFKSDWTPSNILTQTYTVDVTPPTITTRVWPTPTATGWNNTDVTVTFVCADNSGVVNCPGAVVINQDGPGQVVTGTASDGAGNQASGSVTVNIDRTPGTVTISSPADGLITSATSIVLSGDVSDGWSDIASATCNGVPATITDGHVECTVTLQPGLNSLVLFARDAAGNGISAGVRVTRTGPFSAIRLDPSGRTLLVDESQAFTLLDEYGVAVTGSTWASSDTDIVTVDASGVVTAVAAGTATITATAQGLTAEGTITVGAGASLPYGTTRWTVTPASGFTMTSHIYTHRVDETVPDLFTVETNGAGAMVVRALTASGESRWTASAPGAPVYGDSFGGIVAELRDESGDPRGLVRFAGPAGALPWRYESPGYISAGAQAPDGTIYTTELIRPAGSPGWFQGDMSVVVIDGQTGRVRARIPVPRNVQVRDVSSVYPTCATRHEVWEYTPYATRPVVSADGNGYIQLEHWTRTTRGECLETNSVNDVSKDVQQTLTLLRVQPTGVTSSETLFDFQFSGGSTACEWVPRAGSTLPDGLGGRLATWDRYQNFGCAQDYHLFATRFDATGARADHLLATSHVGAPEIVLTGDDGTAYISTYNGVPTAVDVATWTTKWTSTVAGVPVMALAGGGVVLHSGTGALSVIDGSGAITETAQFALSDPIHAAAGRWVGVSSPLGGPQLMAVTGPALMEAAFSFQRGRGNRQAQRAQKVPTLVHLVPAPILRNAPEFYHAWHLEAAINAAVGPKLTLSSTT